MADAMEIFDAFCKDKFGGARSTAITREKGERIVASLKTGEGDTHFRHYVKPKGFRLMHYPALMLQDVLSLPASKKDKVSAVGLLRH